MAGRSHRSGAGCTFEGRNRNALLGEWRTVSHVVELDAPRVFRWAVVDPDNRFGEAPPDPRHPLATWWFVVEAEDGGTRLRHGARIGPARSGLSLAIDRAPEKEEVLVRSRLDDLRTGIERTLAGIRALAEGAR
ncbi:MAG TPA: SRPBCC family protein [Pseudonocardiaceae bacterium]